MRSNPCWIFITMLILCTTFAQSLVQPQQTTTTTKTKVITETSQQKEVNQPNDVYEDDMILNAEQKIRLHKNNSNDDETPMTARNAIIKRNYLWPNKVIYYRISNDFSPRQINVILQAMFHIATRTCLRFEPVTTTNAFVYITGNNRGGCSSAVGYQGRPQYINLQRRTGCLRLGSIVHELLHTIGFYHEHSASDRDRFVRIRLQNVQTGKEHNFAKYPPGLVSSYGVGYDYASVMHYGIKAFTRNGLDTIEPLSKWAAAAKVKMGQRDGLSEKDVMKIRRMYQC